MKTSEKFKILIAELYRVHSDSFDWKGEKGFPGFSTAKNGRQVQFPGQAQLAFSDLARSLYDDADFHEIRIEYESFRKIVKLVIVDIFAENGFADLYDNGDTQIVKIVNEMVGEELASLETSFTHHFPAWTAKLEAAKP